MPKERAPAKPPAYFRRYSPHIRRSLLALRKLILDTARGTEGVGPLQEALRWNQPSFLTARSKSGSTIRIDQVRGSADEIALYVNCRTNLVSRFRRAHPGLCFDGSRAIVLRADDPLPAVALKVCVAMALTYKMRGSKAGATQA